MAVKLALTGSGAAKFLAVTAMAGLAGGGYQLASAASHGASDQGAQARAAHATASHSTAPESTDVDAVEAADTSASDEGAPSATPSPNLAGLCKAYQAHKDTNPDGWKQSAAFQVLITAAGGDAAVSDYCVTLVGPAAAHGKPTDLPGQATDHPGRDSHPGPDSHPGKPSGAGDESGDANESETAEAPEPAETDSEQAPDTTDLSGGHGGGSGHAPTR